MRGLSELDLIHAWEQGLGLAPAERPLALLAVACPQIARDKLAALSLGELDSLLLELREQTLGDAMQVFGQCPHCQESLEFTLPAAVLRAELRPDDAARSEEATKHQFDIADWHLKFRFPTAQDLVVAGRCGDVPAARRLLLRHCILQAYRRNVPVDPQDLPDDVIAAVGTRMAELDSSSEILLALRCPGCEQSWQVQLDVGRFFWEEINALAKRLLLEVHMLARAYGWSEVDILSMSAARRQFYLEMVC